MTKYIAALLLLFGVLVRLVGITTAPPAPYWEEVALGYDAYSIAQTGKDHHGSSFPIMAFESFGDWKPSGYFYAIVPFIYLFDLSVLAVRLPSALAGIAILLGVMRLAKEFGVHKNIALAVAAFSLWGIHFSRSAWEANLATALIVWGIYYLRLGLSAKNPVKIHTILGALFFAGAAYTYHATRVIAPMLYLVILFERTVFLKNSYQLQNPFTKGKSAALTGLLGLIVLIFSISPLILSSGDKAITNRFAETSIFSNLEPIIASNQAQETAGNTPVARILHHRYLYFGQEIALRFMSHFRLDFLFISGDANPRHSSQISGHLYYLDAVFLFLAVFVIVRRKKPSDLFLLAWIVLSIIPASVTYGTPHALRILPALPAIMLLIGIGVQAFFDWYSLKEKNTVYKKIVLVAVVLGYALQFTQVALFYSIIYPKVYAQEWQYGYSELFTKLKQYESEYESIYVTRKDGRPAMYYFFYNKINPELVQAASKTALKDQGEFLTFGKYFFVNQVGEDIRTEKKAIFASAQTEFDSLSQAHSLKQLDTVVGLDGKVVWVLYTKMGE